MATTRPRTKVLYTRVEPRLHKAIRVLAAQRDTNAADLVRDALIAYLENNGKRKARVS